MVIDSSAVIAILFDEPERRALNEKIEADQTRLVSVVSYVEAALVIESRLGEAGGRELDLLLHRAEVELTPVDPDQAEIARDAFRRYGRGRHAAALSFGDCFAYALARTTGEPLLFKGSDFSQTDIVVA
jgi:ribonuclease VapC